VNKIASGRRGDLEAERNFLLDSITDLDREHAAGDIDDADYQTLRDDYVRRAAQSLRALEELDGLPEGGDEPTARTVSGWRRFRRYLGRRRVRLVLGTLAVVFLLAGVGLFAAHLAGVRLPGQSATGTITLSQAALVNQDLQEAALAANVDEPQTAVALYEEVLAKVPDQQVALTYDGWLTRLAGENAHKATAVRAGDAQLSAAARLHPGYPDGEGLYGIAAYEDDHDVAAAVVAFTRCAADKPSKELLGAVVPVAKVVFRLADKPLPSTFSTESSA
jgi:hypothetical protein